MLVEMVFARKQGKKDDSKITEIQHPSQTPQPPATSHIMLFNAKLLDNVNALGACVKIRSKFRDRFVVCKMRSDDRMKDTHHNGRMC